MRLEKFLRSLGLQSPQDGTMCPPANARVYLEGSSEDSEGLSQSQYHTWLIETWVHGKAGGESKESQFPLRLPVNYPSSVGKVSRMLFWKGWRYLVKMSSEEGEVRTEKSMPKPQSLPSAGHITSNGLNELWAGRSQLNYIIYFRFISWITTWDTMFLGCSWYISEITKDFKQKKINFIKLICKMSVCQPTYLSSNLGFS